MDGTLWDATASYAKIWNVTSAEHGIDLHLTRDDLLPLMGKSIGDILHELMGDCTINEAAFLESLMANEHAMMPQLGGVLFPGVKEGLERLKEHYRLFMLSNCSSRGLVNFTAYTGTTHLFDGLLTQGERPVAKSENLKYMKERYSLESPAYVGDTQSDYDNATAANVPFVFASYGFGHCENPRWTCADFDELVNLFLD